MAKNKKPVKKTATKKNKPAAKKATKKITPAAKAIKAPAGAKKAAKPIKKEVVKKVPVAKKPEVVAVPVAPPAPKPTTRPQGHIFTVMQEDVNEQGQRLFLAGQAANIMAGKDFTFRRQDDKIFLIEVPLPDGNKQQLPRPMGSMEMANQLMAELIDMENRRGEAPAATHVTDATSMPQQPAKKKGKASKNTIQQPNGVVLVEACNIDELMDMLPLTATDAVPTQALKNPVHVPQEQNAFAATAHQVNNPVPGGHGGAGNSNDLSQMISINNQAAVTKYAQSLEADIYAGPQMRIHGGIRGDELNRTLASCMKEYSFQRMNDGQGEYIIVSHGAHKARVPADESKFITVF